MTALTTPKYRIEADGNSWNICQRFIAGQDAKEPGKVTYTAVKYFANLEQAAERLLEICARENLGDATGCDAIIAAVEQAKLEVLEAVRESKEN